MAVCMLESCPSAECIPTSQLFQLGSCGRTTPVAKYPSSQAGHPGVEAGPESGRASPCLRPALNKVRSPPFVAPRLSPAQSWLPRPGSWFDPSTTAAAATERNRKLPLRPTYTSSTRHTLLSSTHFDCNFPGQDTSTLRTDKQRMAAPTASGSGHQPATAGYPSIKRNKQNEKVRMAMVRLVSTAFLLPS